MANNCCGEEDLVDIQTPDTRNSEYSEIKWSGRSTTFGAAAEQDEKENQINGHDVSFCEKYTAAGELNVVLTTNSKTFGQTPQNAPQGDIEVKLASMWRELFRIEKISRFDTFLALGGHSLLAVRFINKVSSLGAKLSVSTVLSPITLCELAGMIELDLQKSIYVLPSIEANLGVDLVPLTFAQQRLWLVAQKNRDSPCCSVSVELRLRGILNTTAWQDSLNAMLLRHRILGATFVLIDGKPRMRLNAQITAIPIHVNDLRAAADSEKALEHLRREEALETFDVSIGPLIRTRLIRLADEKYVFTLTQHRLIADDWSVRILLRELSIIYEALAARQANPLSPLKIQYEDYALWERQWLSNDNLQPLAEYWRTRLEGMPENLNLPTDRPRLGRHSYVGEYADIALDAELTKSLKNLSEQHGTTLFATILTGWTAVLSRLSGQDDIVIGTPCANRHRSDIEGLIGLFANILALRIDTSGAPSVAEMLSRVREVTIAALDHQELPFDRVVDIVRPDRGTAASPIFQVMFSWQQNKLCEITSPGLNISVENPNVDSIQVDLHLDLCERHDAVCGTLGFAAELFDRETVSRYVHYLQATLQAMVADVGMTMDKIEILSSAERTLMLETWNATALAQPDHLCAHQIFENHVLMTPEATALVYEDEILKYSELNSRANRLARRLIELGVVPDQLVGLCVSRSPALIIGLLAILKAGGGYVPLDPIYASSRLVQILDDVAPSLVVADRAGCMAIGEKPLANVIVVDPNSSYSYSDSNPRITGLTSKNLMYGIYTSGSTGTPKGIMAEHRGFVNVALSQITSCEVQKDSRILQFTSIGFDVSVIEIMMALMSGAALHVSPQYIRQDPYKLWEHIDKRGITHVSLVPSFLRDCSTLPPISIVPTVILCGEASSPWLIQNLRHRAKFIINYGPAETLPVATAWKDGGVLPGDLVPIGRPLPNVRLYILDSYEQPVPLGTVGELCIGGIGVTRGYLNQPELTRERFRADPFVDCSDARFYKTGDLVRYLPDGNLLYMGRNDHQVKIRGFRIEPGEIESCLKTYPAVRDAFVTVFEEDGDKRLVAYVLADPIEDLAQKLRKHLLPRFPDYMVPFGFVRLDKFPLSPNGKLDRRALPRPDHDAIARNTYEAPRGTVERILESIWSELLNVERVGRNDSFFALGGHSLLALRLLNKISALGVDIPMSAIFRSDSLAVLAEVIGPHLKENPLSVSASTQIPRDSVLQLSFAQEQLWFLAKFHDDDGEYNISEAFRCRGSLCVESLQRALDTIWSRHEALRSVFVADLGQPKVRLLDENMGIPLEMRDLRDKPDAELALVRDSTEEAHKPFDLECGPLIHARLFRLKDDEYVFLLVQHHIVTDDRSISILTYELNELYHAFLTGRPNPLNPLKIQYRDYAAWQRQWLSADRVHAQSTYWRQALTDAPDLLDLPTDRPRPRQRSNKGQYLPIFIDAELTRSLNCLSMQHGSTLFMTLLAAWGAVLSRLSGQDDLIIGTPCSTRNREEFEDVLGFFVNTLALRLRLSDTQTLANFLTHVRQTVIAAQDHQDIPFEHVVEIVQPIRRLSHTPIFQVAFAWQNDDPTELKLPELKTIPEVANRQLIKFDLELELRETGGRIVGSLGYSTVLFDESTIKRHIGYFQTMLRAMVADPDQLVPKIDLLTSEERTLLLKTWNSTEKSPIIDVCFHHLVEQQVARTPQAVALVCEEQTVTYDEMNCRANALAHRLIELGVLPEELVGICVKRSPELIIGQLAVMKAGGAHVPLDPAYPRARISQILSDAAFRIIIADEAGTMALGEDALSGLIVLNPNQTHHDSRNNPKVSDLTPRRLAYVIYTSGSTGRPKGVMIEHRGVVNLALSEIELLNVKPDSRVLFFYSISFDGSIGEIVIAIASGASLHIPLDDVRHDPRKLWNYVAHHGITHVNMIPTFLQDTEVPTEITPETIFLVGGEAVNSNLVCNLRDRVKLFIAYGPTESTIHTTVWNSNVESACGFASIGRPLKNEQLYILDIYQQPVPLGVVGEIYIGGVGVARGYLNRPELTKERFVVDSFSDNSGGRLYRTGDLGRFLPNGNVVYVGRTDHQIKMRGFRIETGEIEACLISHNAVHKAHVTACDHRGSKRLVAYVVADEIDQLALTLRMHVASLLPDYMVPSAFVGLEGFPMMPNGKLNKAALPMPGATAFAQHCYEAPENQTEQILASIWSELLGVERVGRNDSFFDLGGHSLIAIKMIDSLHRVGLTLSVHDLFDFPILSEFAQTVRQEPTVSIPATKIPSNATALTPDMFPLVDLTQTEIDNIVAQVTGGITNIQDIYALSPLQNGILFHHVLLTTGDPYLLRSGKIFPDSAALYRYLEAVQKVIDRHDTLRTSFVWTGLSAPAQVVWRRATLSITELKLFPENGPIRDQLINLYDPLKFRMDLNQAPLLRYATARNDDGTWTLLQVMHHMIGDHITRDTMDDEIGLYLSGKADELLDPVPYRNLIFQTRQSEGDGRHIAFFTQMLADIDDPTLPFELTANHHDGSQLHSSYQILPSFLNEQLREQAKRLEVSVASLCHLAFARVIAQSSGQDQVVFGTVLAGRMQSSVGGYNGMGLYMNTLPLRFDVDDRPVQICVREMHNRLCSMLQHEHAPLALAQRCSNVPSSMPLFSALFNYRYIAASSYCESDDHAIESFEAEELSSYALNLNVEEYGTTLGLTSIVLHPIDPGQICAYMQQALKSLVDALKLTPFKPMQMLQILPEEELTTLLKTWNSTARECPDKLCIHQLFERQVKATPNSIAVVYENHSITYAELNDSVNRLAHRLIKLGVTPDEPVVICVERSIAMIVGLLAIMKAGGAYVPLDPSHPSARLTFILNDVGPNVVLTDEVGHAVLGEANLASLTELNLNLSVNESTSNPQVPGLTSRHLAYVMYTSGSTGTPKGVMVEHRGLVNLALSQIDTFKVDETSRILLFVTFSFDISAGDITMALLSGATLHVASDDVREDPRNLWDYVAKHRVTHASLVPALFRNSELLPDPRTVLTLMMVGEPLSPHVARKLNDRVELYNVYGPTEATVAAAAWYCGGKCIDNIVPIGRPLSNVRLYILNKHDQLVPSGVVGELYIGGLGVARGYYHQQNLTAERFVADPFDDDIDARLYKTGDLARYLPDGRVVIIGRNDQQVKIRGFRIELGEIEICLATHPAVRGAVVTAVHHEDEPQLVAYVVVDAADDIAQILRAHLTSRLPNYMIPVAFVKLHGFPLTPTGKIDLKALPLPDRNARARHVYEAPQGPVETAVARVWRDILKIEQISRNDSFFDLGGHSLIAIKMIDRLHRVGLMMSVHDLFEFPILSEFAVTVRQELTISIPATKIPSDATTLTPDMFPLIDLTQTEIDNIVAQVTGGVTNIQDIYALSPLQNGMLFHHLLLTTGDPYLLRSGKIYPDSAAMYQYLEAVQKVIDRHDALRTSFVWTGLSSPAQVVWRRATLSITELKLSPENGPIRDQLINLHDPLKFRMDLTQAPLLHYVTARNNDGTWTLLQVMHHMIGDHITRDIMDDEIRLYLSKKEDELLDPVPYRNLIFQTRQSEGDEKHIAFFTQMLADIDDPTLPFELTANHHDGSQLHSSHQILPSFLSEQLREQAKRLEVSVASLCHLAFARVIAQSSGQDQVVFGTVLAGRMHTSVGGYNGMGLYMNTLPLRFDVDDRPVQICVREMYTRLCSMLKHEHASLALAQRCSNVPSSMPLFSALINYRYIAASSYCESDDHAVESFETAELTSYALTLNIEEYGTTLELTSIVLHPIDPGQICAYLQQALQSLTDALKLTPFKSMRMLEILPKKELTTLLRTWNSTAKDFPDKLCIHQLFERQVKATPNSVAVVYKNHSMTYAELNNSVNRLAHRLIKLGVAPDEPVVICVERSIAMVVGLLAIMKAGGAYVPLDPSHPSARLTYILDDVGPNIVLTDMVGHAVLGESNLASLTELNLDLSVNESTSNPQVPGLTSRHLAYVMYTSGSTGTPKGVMVEHRGLVNLALSQIDTFKVDETSRILLFVTFSFDISAGDITMALLSGATLHVASDDVREDPRNLWDYVAKHRVTHASLVPALFRNSELLPDPRTVLTLMMVGEPLSPHVARRLNDRVELYNVYGPTEATVAAAAWYCGGKCIDNIVPIGRPLSNVRLYILNKHDQLVPTGVVGELYIGGSGVARGYYHRQNLTAERFVADPFDDDIDARLYKTGDLARYLPDGRVVIIGRNDQQVKIRGFRIELGEIEICLATHPAVRGAVVTAIHQEDEPQLVAYVVVDAADDIAQILRAHLTSRLPNYMIPVAFVKLHEFPLTPTGKIDLKALPLPDEKARARHVYEAPQGLVETAVAHVWRDLFKIERISRNDSFLALGGDSLMAVRMIGRLAHVAVDFPVSIVFQTSSLAELASVISTRLNTESSVLPSISQIPRDTVLPSSFAQQRLWITSKLDDVRHAYNIPLVLRIRGSLNKESLRRALDTIYARHDALRSRFVCIKDEPWVCLLDSNSGMPFIEHDIRDEPDADVIAERIITEETHKIFDLETGSLVRACLIWLRDQEHFFVLTQHHIVSDGWSITVIIRELNTLYAAFEAGETASLLPMHIQYADYASWQRQWLSPERLQGQADYWLASLVDAPILLSLPTDRRRPNHRSYAGRCLPVVLDSELTTSLLMLSKRQGTTLFMTILAAWAAVLSRISGQDDLVIATPTANRIRPELEDLVGCFVNLLALRIDLSKSSTAAELLACVRETVVASQDNQNLPFEHVIEIVRPQRSRNHTALFQVIFSWQNTEKTIVSLPGLDIMECKPVEDTAEFDLQLYLYEMDQKIMGHICFATELFDSQTVIRQVEYLRATLQGMVDDVHRSVHTFDILTSSERRLLLKSWNATEMRFPDDKCIHQLIEQQALKIPHSPALIAENIVFTFAEMNARANGLAHRLIELGVVPEQRVVICVARSPAMVIAVLAVLKAGGTYVPLDPTYGSQRLKHIFNDAACSIILADEAGVTALGSANLSKFNVIDPRTFKDARETNPRVAGLTARNLAYVIYTSGSTGKPKGVMIEHRSLVNTILSHSELYGLTASSRMLQVASFGFDTCTWEIMSATCRGSALYFPSFSVRRDPHSLFTYIADHAITHAFFTPSFLQHADNLPMPETPLTLVLSGEASSIDLLRKLGKKATVFNSYGPTECAIANTTWLYSKNYDAEGVPIGRPINNTQLYILDVHELPVPTGTVGELYIGGVGVARGYFNRPDLTAERFIADTFGDSPNGKLYRTGDLARYLPDGNVIFLGRNDDQVNIRGFRIEPREIEACMMTHAGVRKALVVKKNIQQTEHLIAYVLAEPEEKLIEALRLHLKAHLPAYMIPSAIVRLDAIPLTPHGKLDYRALPIPNENASARQDYEAPKGNVESALAYTWTEILGVEQVSRRDNFFALGGHSLLAIRAKHLASERGVSCTLNDIFQYPVLADLAEQVTRDSMSQSSTVSKAVPVRSDGSEPPIFFLPTGIGDFSYTFGLSRDIQSNCPTFVLPWPSIYEPYASKMHEFTSNMVTLLKSVQTTGPYRICGYSLGGILAYAIAEHLLAAHESVTFVGLIDAVAPNFFRSRDVKPKEIFVTALIERFGDHKRADIVSLSDEFDDLCSTEFTKAAQEVGLYPVSACLDSEVLRLKQMSHHMQLVLNYQPGESTIPVYQFYADGRDQMDSDVHPEVSPVADPSMGWSQVVSHDKLRLIPVPGNHDSIVSEPDNRKVLGQAINDALKDC